MAKTVALLCRNNYLRILNKPVKQVMQYNGFRYLYSESALGLGNYMTTRENVNAQFSNMTEKFKSKMNEIMQGDNSLVFTEDLKNMIHLAENNEEDIKLTIEMMKKFNKQNSGMRFGSFVFGPVVMRWFHYLNKPDEAFECFKDPDMEGFFDQLMSYTVLLDLLFINKRYAEMIEVYEIIKSKQILHAKYPKHVLILVFGALYKQNTPESLQYGAKMWTEMKDAGHIPMRRAATFMAALAINQGSPHIAIEILYNLRNQTYFTIRNLKIAALADVGRPEDALPILASILNVDEANQVKHTALREVVDKLGESVKKLGNKDVINEFNNIEKQLTQLNHITDTTLDDFLCGDMEIVQAMPHQLSDQQKANMIRRKQNDRYNQRWNRVQRPGLQDMH